MASSELDQERPGLIKAVVFSGFASKPGPEMMSPFGLKFMYKITRVRDV